MGYFDGEGLIPIAIDAGADGLFRLKEIGGGRADGLGICGDLAQRSDVVENPEAATVSTDDQIVHVVIGGGGEIAERSGRKVLAQRLPVIAVIEADVDGGLSAGKEQARLLGIGAENVHPASGAFVAGQAVDDAGPSLAAVGSAPDERHVRVLIGGLDSSGAALAADAAGDVSGS